jgi:hypothetical protein
VWVCGWVLLAEEGMLAVSFAVDPSQPDGYAYVYESVYSSCVCVFIWVCVFLMGMRQMIMCVYV